MAILALVFVGYALVANRLELAWITAPMVFVTCGFLLGPEAFDLVRIEADDHTLLALTELTLAVLLFADASTVRVRDVEDDAGIPGRLLAVGLPLTIGLGALAAVVLLDQPWAEAALIASILAPTDAALGMAMVTDRAVPTRIRRALNVESGLNDGIATPFVTLFLTLVATQAGLEPGSWIADASKELGLAVVAALVVGIIGGSIFTLARRRGWTSATSETLAVLSLAVLSYVGATAIGGNGFVAAFAGGLLFGATSKVLASGEEDVREAVEFTETLGTFLSFFVWTAFGTIFVSSIVADGIDPLSLVYAAVSLTIVRMVPVAIGLVGTKLRADTVAFMGWFGPRGLASVVFTLLALEQLHDSPFAESLLEVTTLTILGSVLLHGLSAKPLAAAYGRRVRSDSSAVELVHADEPRVRRHDLADTQET